MQRQIHRAAPLNPKLLRVILVLLFTALCCPARLHPQTVPPQSDPSSPHSEYSNRIRQNYSFPFGKDMLSAPGNASIEGNDFVEPGAFPTATYCAHCHQEAYRQWRQALHSNSFRTPFYRTSVNLLMNTKGIEFARHCDSCHNPIGVFAGALTKNSQVNHSFDEDGLTCMTCHSIQQLKSTSGNGSYVMGIPSVMVNAEGKRIPGEVPYYQIMNHPERHSAAVMKDIYRKPEFCAACHKASLPHSMNDYKFIRAFTVYDEWQTSKFSQRNPLNFYQADYATCQNCHMPRNPLNGSDYGAKHGTFASHRWLAGNTAVPFYYGFDTQLQKTIDFLRSGNYLDVDLFALKLGDALIAPLGTKPFRLEPKETLEVRVVIQNKNIGHSLVPEVRDLYEAWVEFLVQDASGKEIYHSGFIKPDGMLDQRAHSFTNRPVDIYGDFVDNHEVWTIHSVAYDNTIQSGRSALVRYQFQIPGNVKGPLTVTARVNYRHFRQSYLNNVFGPDHPAYPVVQMASRTQTFAIGENAPTPPKPGENPEWMRWNNYGIGLMDEQQYAEAIQAFQQVVRLRPDYADGYTNIALTNLQWEKYSAARPDLEKALALSPHNARALYYLAIIEKRSGHPAAELADLQQVITQYPQARDPRRELGVYYMQQHEYKEALTQFKTLQAIDPDDVAAHYNLSLLYRRMGLKDKAAEQAALYASKVVDPRAPTYSLDYLRSHPEIGPESDLWHLHTDMADPAPPVPKPQ